MSSRSIINLDLGAGKKKRPDHISVDVSDVFKPDIIHDLNVFPYPFKSNSIDAVCMDNVLEHLDSPLDVLSELHRILKTGGELEVCVPYFRSVWASIDPTHKHFFTSSYFLYFDPKSYLYKEYRYVDFAFENKRIVFNEGLNNGYLKRLIVKIANRWPGYYDLYISHWFPLDQISFQLVKV